MKIKRYQDDLEKKQQTDKQTQRSTQFTFMISFKSVFFLICNTQCTYFTEFTDEPSMRSNAT